MISIQSYRLPIGLFQLKIKSFKAKGLTYDDFKRGERGGIKFNLILICFLLGVCINSSYSKRCQEANNKNIHSLNGNISKKGTISLFTWNKGNSTFGNKRDDIFITIDRFKPDIFAIHEANFDISRDKNFENYNIEYNTIAKGL